MKTLTTLLLIISISASAQPLSITQLAMVPMLPQTVKQPPKVFRITWNDAGVMALEFAAGHLQGWREEVLYHPFALFAKFPNLNRDFWDIHVSWKGSKWDANHVLKGMITQCHIAAVVIKIGDLKSYRKKDRWKKIVFDSVKYYISYQAGFASSYYLIHKNKMF